MKWTTRHPDRWGPATYTARCQGYTITVATALKAFSRDILGYYFYASHKTKKGYNSASQRSVYRTIEEAQSAAECWAIQYKEDLRCKIQSLK